MSEKATVNRVVIPYTYRSHFKRLHDSIKRFMFVVAHRRAGKSVAIFNELLKRALRNERKYPPPRYAYIGPSFAQTKDLIWGYAKHYTAPLPNVVKLENDLQMTLPNGAIITLYGGAAAYERMRGLYFDGVALDEYPMLHPQIISSIIRPCLADYRGWMIVSGTSNGDDHFAELRKKALKDDDWEVMEIPVTSTDALHPDEVQEMTKDMSPEEYAREMLCSFDAPKDGAYYGDLINKAQAEGRITKVPHDPSVMVYTFWDLGIADAMAVWFMQKVGKELHFIDYEEDTGKGLDHFAALLKNKPYNYATHVMPHDIKARELGSGRTRQEMAMELLGDIFVCDNHRVEDGINAVRSVLPMCYFDSEKCQEGLAALKNYSRTKNGTPNHNWASHGSDAFRIGSVALNKVIGYMSSSNVTSIFKKKALKRRIRGIY